MLGVAPFMTVGPKLRTWLAMMAASGAAMIVPPLSLGPQIRVETIGWYIVIDALSGWAVLAHPAGWAQKLIGALFALMVSFHIGFLIADHPATVIDYLHWLTWAGWLQWAVLASWGLYDAGKMGVDRARGRFAAPPAGAGV